VGDDDAIFLRLQVVLHDERAIRVGHLEAVDHHHGANGHRHARAPALEHLGKMSVLEEELSGAFVIFLIERAAGNKDSDGHGKKSGK